MKNLIEEVSDAIRFVWILQTSYFYATTAENINWLIWTTGVLFQTLQISENMFLYIVINYRSV